MFDEVDNRFLHTLASRVLTTDLRPDRPDQIIGGAFAMPTDISSLECVLDCVSRVSVGTDADRLGLPASAIWVVGEQFDHVMASVTSRKTPASEAGAYDLHCELATKADDTPHTFDQLDLNGDGAVSQFEYEQAKAAESSLTDAHYWPKLLSHIIPEVLSKLPAHLSAEQSDSGSMDTFQYVLAQQLICYSNLVSLIHKSLTELSQALRGRRQFSPGLIGMAEHLSSKRIPQCWKEISYQCDCSLGLYVDDLKQRVDYVENWRSNGRPTVLWLGVLYRPQALMLAVLQQAAEAQKCPIEQLTMNADVLLPEQGVVASIVQGIVTTIPCSDKRTSASIAVLHMLAASSVVLRVVLTASAGARLRSQVGVYAHGMFLRGGQWNLDNDELVDLPPSTSFSAMPVIHFNACPVDSLHTGDQSVLTGSSVYMCPLYCTPKAVHNAKSKMHLDNFVIYVPLETSRSSDHWVMKGLSMVCSIPGSQLAEFYG